MKNIYLIGFMGAGKSTVGKILADKLGATFKDMDAIIEASEGTSINEIFTNIGESYFRNLETVCLRDLSDASSLVVSTGGGIIERLENRKLLNKGMTVFLSVEWNLILERIAATNDRPLASRDDEWQSTYQLFCQRLPLYQDADCTIECLAKPPELIANEIIQTLKI